MTKHEKYRVNNYSCLNQFSRRKIAFSIWQLLHPEVTINPFLLSLHLLLFMSLAQKGRKLCPKKAHCTCITRLLHPYVFPVSFPPSINSVVRGNSSSLLSCIYICVLQVGTWPSSSGDVLAISLQAFKIWNS